MNIFDKATARSNINIVANHRGVTVNSTDGSELRKVYVIAYNSSWIHNNRAIVSNI